MSFLVLQASELAKHSKARMQEIHNEMKALDNEMVSIVALAVQDAAMATALWCTLHCCHSAATIHGHGSMSSALLGCFLPPLRSVFPIFVHVMLYPCHPCPM